MPAPALFQTQTDSMLELQENFSLNKALIAQTAWQKMVDYNPTGAGTWNGPFEWVCPEEKVFMYDSSFGAIRLDGNDYSALGADDKALFHRWLPQFSKRFVIRYNKEFGI